MLITSPLPPPQPVSRMVDDLHRLINFASNQPKPLLLVGVDYSTFVARFYTQIYEQWVGKLCTAPCIRWILYIIVTSTLFSLDGYLAYPPPSPPPYTPTGSDVAGLLLIDPLFEGLFLDEVGRRRENADSAESDHLPKTWSDYWTNLLTPRWTGVWISAAVGFNRLSLMVGLSSPVEDPGLNDILPKDVILRKVSEFFLIVGFLVNFLILSKCLQKYLMCQPRHLSSAFYEFHFTNESMNQMR